jgi:hypothetical protein
LVFVQRQYIIQQLKENEADLDAADQELELVNSEQNYDLYAPSRPQRSKRTHRDRDLNLSVLTLPPVRTRSYLKWLEENRKNMKATAQMTSVLPEGPPPRASIESSKNTVHRLLASTIPLGKRSRLFARASPCLSLSLSSLKPGNDGGLALGESQVGSQSEHEHTTRPRDERICHAHAPAARSRGQHRR